MVGGDCLEHSMPDFVKCAASPLKGNYAGQYFARAFLRYPLQEAGPLLAEYVGKVRASLGCRRLPQALSLPGA